VPSGAIWNDVLEVGTADNILKAGTQKMVPSDASWNEYLECVTAERILKSRTLNGVFWRNLKRRLVLRKQGRLMVPCDAIWNDLLEVENAEEKNESEDAYRCFLT